jgi:DnaJ-class molecular chaperone
MDKERACEILGISLDHKENAKKAYLRLSKEKHPDRGGDPEEFLLIHAAYRTIVEMEKPDSFRTDKVEFNVKVSLEEAVFGVTVQTHIRPQTASTTSLPEAGKSAVYLDMLTVTETLPPMALLKEPLVKVYPGKLVGGSERELVVCYSLREHERYRLCRDRSRALLSVEQSIPVLVALHGGVVEVETMFGPRKLNVRAGTNIGDAYIIKNHGQLGGLEVVISGMEMPIVDDPSTLEVDELRQREVDEEDRILEGNAAAAEEIRSRGPSSASSP